MGDRDQSGEREAVARLLAYLTAKGWTVAGVYDGGGTVRTQTPAEVMANVFGVDESSIRVYKHRGQAGSIGTHGIAIVLGNADDGSEIISDWDYSTNDTDGFNRDMEAYLHDEAL